LLAARLGNVLANRTILSVVLAASIIVGALAVQVASMSSELASKSKTIELQSQEIEEYLATISAQKQEVEDKAAALEELDAEIVTKTREVDSLGANLAVQGAEMAGLQKQVQRLQEEIALLQSKIESDIQYVESLSKQLELTQQSAKRVKISHYSLAVINNERGIVFPIEVEIINSGTGAISVDVSNAMYEDAFQSAVRTAAVVASEHTGESISDKDIIVRIISDQPDTRLATIDGSSAGALIAGMIVAGLSDGRVNYKVLITVTINPNGTVGKVGSLEEKNEAALDFGANVLLVPESQEFDSERIIVVGVLDIDEVVKYLVVSK
jgi:PDZ domain-containing secreted protein